MKNITNVLLAILLSFTSMAQGDFTVVAPDGSLELPKSIFMHHRGYYGGEGEDWCYLKIYEDSITQGIGWDVTSSKYKKIMQKGEKVLVALEGSMNEQCTTYKFWEFDFSEYLSCIKTTKGCDSDIPVFKVRTFKSEKLLLEATPSDYSDQFYDAPWFRDNYEDLDEISLYYSPERKDAAYKLKGELESQGFLVKIMDSPSQKKWVSNLVNKESYTSSKYPNHYNVRKVKKIASSVLGHNLKLYSSKNRKDILIVLTEKYSLNK